LAFLPGLANRGLGSLETAQDDNAEEAVKMQALADGNQFYADCNFHFINYSKYYFFSSK
jgi:hypothetical protein